MGLPIESYMLSFWAKEMDQKIISIVFVMLCTGAGTPSYFGRHTIVAENIVWHKQLLGEPESLRNSPDSYVLIKLI